MNSIGNIKFVPWKFDYVLKYLIEVLDPNNLSKTLIVGGAVRDAILNRSVIDFDLVTILNFKDIFKILKEANIKVECYNINYGSVIVNLNNRIFEITKLRQDIKTFYRKSYIHFVYSWQADTLRRDFTINGFYSDFDGFIYSPLNISIKDLKNNKIKFIGLPDTKLLEDILRFLRFFRFSSTHGRGYLEKQALEACEKYIKISQILSGYRFLKEIKTMILISKSLLTLTKISQSHISLYMFGCNIGKKKIIKFNSFFFFEEKFKLSFYFFHKLFSLIDLQNMIFFVKRWKISKNERLVLKYLIVSSIYYVWRISALFKVCYFNYLKKTLEIILISCLLCNQSLQKIEDSFIIIKFFNKVKFNFPLQKLNVLHIGFLETQGLENLFEYIKNWWINSINIHSKQDCLNHLFLLSSSI